jgi:protein-tyrosine-phosphatase
VPDERNSASPSDFLQSRMLGKRYKVLFLCRDNAVHGIMAEALLKRWGDADFCAFSAGIEPSTAIDPHTLELLKEAHLWHSGLHPKGYQEFFRRDARLMDFVITVGERAPDCTPKKWPGNPQIFHWRITSPEMVTSAEVPHAFRKAFTELETRIRLFVLVYQKEKMKRAVA